MNGGGYAEVAVTDARLVAPLPEAADQQTLARAAAAPSNTTTAILVLDQVARLRPGEQVLVHAAAGGVGSQLGQAARLLGAGQVIGIDLRDQLPLADASEAHRRIGSGHTTGKLVLAVAPLPRATAMQRRD